eukprot:55569_1
MFAVETGLRPNLLSHKRKQFLVYGYTRINFKTAVPNDIIAMFSEWMDIINVPIMTISIVDTRTSFGTISHGSIIGLPTKDINNENELIELFKSTVKKINQLDIPVSKGYFMKVENWRVLKVYDENVNKHTLFLYVRFNSRHTHAAFVLFDKQMLGFNIIVPVKK